MNGEPIFNQRPVLKVNDTVDRSQFTKIATLKPSQLNYLTDILYNYGMVSRNGFLPMVGCYNPREAILFIDENDRVFEYLEICFECQKMYGSSDSVAKGPLCKQKLDMLATFFNAVQSDGL